MQRQFKVNKGLGKTFWVREEEERDEEERTGRLFGGDLGNAAPYERWQEGEK